MHIKYISKVKSNLVTILAPHGTVVIDFVSSQNLN